MFIQNKICLSLALLSFIASAENLAVSAKKFTKLNIVGETISGELRYKSRSKKGSRSRVIIQIDRLSQTLIDDLERGDILEAWLVDEGTATDSSFSSANDDDNENAFADEATDASFNVQTISGANTNVGNVPVINLIEAAPYALSLGQLKTNKEGNYVTNFDMINSLVPYDYLLITQESKGNQGDYDPRPGTQLTRINLDL